jgi:hypothetical protein
MNLSFKKETLTRRQEIMRLFVLEDDGSGGVIPPPLDTNITEALVAFNRVQYTNRLIQLSAIPVLNQLVTGFKWEIRKTSDSSLVGLSFLPAPLISITTPGYYDVYLYLSNAEDYLPMRFRRAFRVFPPKLTEAQVIAAGGYVFDLTPGNIIYRDFTGIDMSDKHIFIKGSSSSAALEFHNCVATAGHPWYCYKADDNVPVSWTCRSGSGHAWWLSGTSTTGNCYGIINGYNADGTRGISVKGNSASTQVFYCDGRFTDIEMAGVYFEHFLNQDAATVAFQPTVSATCDIDTWGMDRIWLFDLVGKNCGEEWFYLGESQQSPSYIGNNGRYPPHSRDSFFAWCSVDSCGRDAYQFGCSLNIEIHNCVALNWGTQNDAGGQTSAVAHNGGSSAFVYNNIFIKGQMAINLQSGLIPWDKKNGETSPRPSVYCNNIFSKGGYSLDLTSQPFAVYGQTADNSGAGVWNVYIAHNIFDCYQKGMQTDCRPNSFNGTDWKCVNNIWIVANNPTGDWNQIDFIGSMQANFTGTVVNDIVRTVGSNLSDLYFKDYANYDYHITNFSSAAYGGSPTDLSSYTQFATYLWAALENYPVVPPGFAKAFGPYSGYNLRKVTPPSPIDPNPATFTTPLSVAGITQFGGTIQFELDKVAILYYKIVSDGASAPSKASILLGGGIQSGAIKDFGTAETAAITGLSQNTAYDLYYFTKTIDGIETSVVKYDFSTFSDVTAPTLTSFNITDAQPARINFGSSEIITASAFAGFTIASPTRTVSGIFINAGQTTGHYLTVSVPFQVGDAPTIAYASVSNQIEDSVGNDLASFGATSITNAILPAPAERVTWLYTNVTNFVKDVIPAVTSGTSIDIESSSTNSYSKSTKAIPANSDGNMYFVYNANSRGAGQEARFGPMQTSLGATTLVNILMSLGLNTGNANVDWQEGNTYVGTISNRQDPFTWYRFEILRSTNKIRIHSAVSTSDTIMPTVWTLHATYTGTVPSVDLIAAFKSTTSGKGIYNAWIQAAKGLI